MPTTLLKNTLLALVYTLVLAAEWACSEKRKQESSNTDSLASATQITAADTLKKITPQQATDALVQTIEQNLSRYTATKPVDVADESLEGGEVVGYYDKGTDLKKIQCWLYGETGKMLVEYFYDKGQPIGVKIQRHQYDKPFYEEGFKTDTIIKWDKYFVKPLIINSIKSSNEPMIFQSDENSSTDFWVRKAKTLQGLIKK